MSDFGLKLGREEGISSEFLWFPTVVYWKHGSQERRDVWGRAAGMAEAGWVTSEVKSGRRVVSKRQELNSANSLTFTELWTWRQRGKARRGIDKNLRINAFCSWDILTAGPPRLTMSGFHFGYFFFSLFALLCLCFVSFFFSPVLHVVSLWLCIQHIWPVAHTHTKGKPNTWVPLLYIHLSMARIVLCSCWFIPLPALSIEDPFQVTNVMQSTFMGCWIDTRV